MTTQIHRIADLKRDLRSIKDAANESAAGSPPAGYDDLEGDALKVADECYHNGLDAMETAILNWIYDQEKLADQLLAPTATPQTEGEQVRYQGEKPYFSTVPGLHAPAPAIAQGETPRRAGPAGVEPIVLTDKQALAIAGNTIQRLQRELNSAKAECVEWHTTANEHMRLIATLRQSLAAVEKERDEAQSKLTVSAHLAGSYYQSLTTAEAELVELRKDRERIEWLESRDRACLEIHFQPMIGLMEFDQWRIHKNGTGHLVLNAKTLRVAIDSARQQEGRG